MYQLVFSPRAKKDYGYFKKTGNKALLNKIAELLKDMIEHPYEGIGKPEALKYQLSGLWSRRINSEHRLIYSVHENEIQILVISMSSHYEL